MMLFEELDGLGAENLPTCPKDSGPLGTGIRLMGGPLLTVVQFPGHLIQDAVEVVCGDCGFVFTEARPTAVEMLTEVL